MHDANHLPSVCVLKRSKAGHQQHGVSCLMSVALVLREFQRYYLCLVSYGFTSRLVETKRSTNMSWLFCAFKYSFCGISLMSQSVEELHCTCVFLAMGAKGHPVQLWFGQVEPCMPRHHISESRFCNCSYALRTRGTEA